MLSEPTPISLPADPEESKKWGFDIVQPKGTPQAWVHDWNSVHTGFGLATDHVTKIATFDVDEDLSKLTAEEISAARTRVLAAYAWRSLDAVEKAFGEEGLDKFLYHWAYENGKLGQSKVAAKVGNPPSLKMAAWYQDIAHIIYGPPTNGYAWFDDEKQVLTRHGWGMLVPPGDPMDHVRYYRKMVDYWLQAYMEVTPDLFCVQLMDIGDDPEHERCCHLWTYQREVIEELPDEAKERIPAHLLEIVRAKGARI